LEELGDGRKFSLEKPRSLPVPNRAFKLLRAGALKLLSFLGTMGGSKTQI